MRITVGLLAHVDAGKTTLAEQILTLAKVLKQPGRVDHQDAYLDHHPLERQRGITIFAEQAAFVWGGHSFTLVDTPGHVDFSPEMERALQIMDYAVLLVSCVEGVQGHTQTVWRLLRERQVPTILFLNKIDRLGASPERTLEEIHAKLSALACPAQGLTTDHLPMALKERVAEQEEELLADYLEDRASERRLREALRRQVKACQLFPVFSGSALLNQGVAQLLDAFSELVDTTYDGGAPFSAQVYRIRHDGQARLAHIKLLAGSLRVRDSVDTPQGPSKVSALYAYSGGKYTPKQQAVAGELCAVAGLEGVMAGDGLGDHLERARYALEPLLASAVQYGPETPLPTLLAALRELEDEEPQLKLVWREQTQQLQVHVMGTIQLEVLRELVRERYGLWVDFGKSEILYRETIAKPVMGYGHYEPLRHYAEVHLRLEPAPRGSGIRFASECSLEDLDRNNQNLVRTHVLERTHLGVLTGSPLTDVRIVLTNGRAHLKHTEGGDFREATYRAVRQGLEKAENILLEPYYRIRLEAPPELMGRLATDLKKLQAHLEVTERAGDKCVLEGRGPVATLMDFPTAFLSLSKGKGVLSLRFDGYEPCHNPQEVICRIGYDKDADRENASDSVFCAKGAGFLVRWYRVEDFMHCPLSPICDAPPAQR